ncbi:lysM domain receptor-like kinase 3 isoform X2 [Neltuma alba]|uniref:lysM domain receptor-like kinase 3 isoform X2 n=1 Tax=Neltuma alba TaxID=207710 RepID=UPI0010A31D9D|nr:lysM domain receptor-like kinase 3 isoform X2 [Prosopis alba]
MVPRFGFPFLFLLLFSLCLNAESKCKKGCGLALASYYIWVGFTSRVGFTNITALPPIMQSPVLRTTQDIISYNTDQLLSDDYVNTTARVNIPFPCDCIDGEYLGYVFKYPIQKGDTYALVANQSYANLTTVLMLESANSYSPDNIPDHGTLNVTVNCSCGDRRVSKEYGLFITYPLRAEDSLESIANQTKLDEDLLRRYNPGVDFSKGSGVVYIPGKGQNGVFVPLPPRRGLSGGAIAGLSAGAVAGFLLLAVYMYVAYYRKKEEGAKLLSGELVVFSAQTRNDSNGPPAAVNTGIKGITVEKSVEFSYEELARGTNNFSMANKIGQGGFGAVYYAELRGERAAVKKMKSQNAEEFLAELKVLTRVHHLNLVRLIGYCVQKNCLFLVYEYIDNGNLKEHLRDPGREPLPWSLRVRIALDSARALEYIHEHTVPVYIHRDIKPANILIDQNFRAKVADFGLTKLIEVGSSSHLSKGLAGTFGYIPLQNDGTVKTDVYAFGVVLCELISAQAAVLSVGEVGSEARTLVSLFEEALEQPNPEEHLLKLVDPRLEDQYTFDSVYKMVQLAKACTEKKPDRRPRMRSVVVALMALSSASVKWDVASLYENPIPKFDAAETESISE